MTKLSEKWPEDARLKHTNYDDPSNSDYTKKVLDIISALKTVFPRTLDIHQVEVQCVQGKEEITEAYFLRLKECFDRRSGLEKRQPPTEPNEEPVGSDPYDYYLRTLFMDGLNPQIWKAIQKSCVGWQLASSAEVRRHAKHHEGMIKMQQTPKTAKQEKDLSLALIALHVSNKNNKPHHYHYNQRGGGGRRRGRGRGSGRHFAQNQQRPRHLFHLWTERTLA